MTKIEWLEKHGYKKIYIDNRTLKMVLFTKTAKHKTAGVNYSFLEEPFNEMIGCDIEYPTRSKNIYSINVKLLNADLKELKADYEQMIKECE